MNVQNNQTITTSRVYLIEQIAKQQNSQNSSAAQKSSVAGGPSATSAKTAAIKETSFLPPAGDVEKAFGGIVEGIKRILIDLIKGIFNRIIDSIFGQNPCCKEGSPEQTPVQTSPAQGGSSGQGPAEGDSTNAPGETPSGQGGTSGDVAADDPTVGGADDSGSGGETAKTNSSTDGLAKKLRAVLTPDSKGQIHEEQLQHGIVAHLLSGEEGKAG